MIEALIFVWGIWVGAMLTFGWLFRKSRTHERTDGWDIPPSRLTQEQLCYEFNSTEQVEKYARNRKLLFAAELMRRKNPHLEDAINSTIEEAQLRNS